MRQGTKAHVLVVDDDRYVRSMMTMVLEDANFEVAEARDGAKALANMRSSPSRLVVLLDWWMPGMSGEDVLRVVRAEYQLAARHAYVLVTANATVLTPQFKALLRELAVTVISKPFDIQTLIETVEGHARCLDEGPEAETG